MTLPELLRATAALLEQQAAQIDYLQGREERIAELEALYARLRADVVQLQEWAAGETIQAVHGRLGQEREPPP